MDLHDAMDNFVIGLVVLLIGVAVTTLVSGTDEFILDLVYVFRMLGRRSAVAPGEPAPPGQPIRHTEEDLAQLPERPIALMIPAWNEASVIQAMVETTIQRLRYGNYQIFVGTYPNDEATNREVAALEQRYGNVHRAVCPLPGPTNKADCLNSVFERIQDYERTRGVEFALFVQHDAEDLVHPYSLQVFNYHFGSADMLQLPVFALETAWQEFTGSHYVDEFCEHHVKSIPVRELLSQAVPSAGVGCGFSRRALEGMRERLPDGVRLFNERSLTEDYDFALRLALAGYRTRFLMPVLERTVMERSRVGRERLIERRVTEIVATREYFPDEFGAAVRQKSRWILGISIQGWQQLGWPGGFWMRYMLLRDRKTLLTSQINVLGYVVLAGFFFLAVLGAIYPDDYRYPAIVVPGTWLWNVILVDTFFLVWRLILRAHCVWAVYGPAPAIWSMPRLVWGNLIGFAATNRAIWLWLRSKVTGRRLTWEKTAHVYPSEAKISTFRRRLGDLLLEQRQVRVEQLEAALARQKSDPRPLGEILVELGAVTEAELAETLGSQLQLTRAVLDPAATPLAALLALPQALARRYSVYPVAVTAGALVVATTRLMSREELEAIELETGRRVEIRLTTPSELRHAIEAGYRRIEDRP